jgi:predicted dehydrogenase
VRVFSSLRELFACVRVPDVALICTPSSGHFDLAARLLRCGSDLLIEPPLATTRGDAEQLTELAERLGRPLYCRSGLAAAVRRAGLQPLIDGDSLGRLRQVEIRLAHKRDARAGWRSDPALSGGGVLMDLGPHALELAELLAGPFDQLRMLERDHLQRAEVEDAVLLESTHRSGVITRIELDWNGAEEGPLARCRGERGELVIGRSRSALHCGDQSFWVEAPLDEPHCDAAALAEFMALRLDRDAICDDGARMLGWLHAAYRSHELGRWQYA